MRQALHIFRKDARHFRYEIAVSVVFTAAFACSSIFGGPSFLSIVARAVFVIWPLLICLLIQEEPLIGDRQFWITRPYSRASLLAAKALFIVAFVNVPLLLAQFAILADAGFQPLAYLPSFLWVHVVFFAAILLPAVALASVTQNLGQALLTLFGVVAAFIVVGLLFNWEGQTNYGPYPFAWAGTLIEEASCAAAALLILILLWTTRMRWLALGAGVTFYLLIALFSGDLTTTLGTTVQSRIFGERGTKQTVVIMDGSSVSRVSAPPTRQSVLLAVSFRVVNLPDGLVAHPGTVEMTFEDGRGARWASGWSDVSQRDPNPDRAFAWSQQVWLDRRFAQRVGTTPLTVHGSVWLMLNARRGVDLPDNRRTLVPGGGACTVYKRSPQLSWFVACASPFHATFSAEDGIAYPYQPNQPPRATVRLLTFWDSPLPTTFSLSPLSWNAINRVGAETNFLYFYYEPRAYIHRYFTATNVRLP
jgi:hypothetical protein